MFIVASVAVMVINCYIWFEHRSQGLLRGGGGKVFWNLSYLNDDAKLDGNILYTVFYMIIFLSLKLSTVRTLTDGYLVRVGPHHHLKPVRVYITTDNVNMLSPLPTHTATYQHPAIYTRRL